MMRHDVIGMEDYVASDQRPVDKCLADVADSDAYLGIFAWRYGFIPSRDNPEKQSITELEYRKAKELGRPCLIFLSQEDAPWPATMMDAQTGDAGAGERIKQLRAEFADAHMVSYFSTPDQLASRVAAAIFQVNVGMTREHEVSDASERRPSTGRARPRAKYPKLWSPGSVLRVCFIQRNPSFERAIRRYLPLWSVYANVQFEFLADKDAEVRVAFGEGRGNWAYIGTDCMAIPLDQPTMNFGFLDPAEINVLHEFGHVLGLLHEHNHPHGITWNKEPVYKSMTGPPNNWDKTTVDANMFTTWPDTTFPVQKPFDAHSIMAYPMPKEWTSLETDFGYKDSLSPVDKDFIGRLYPYDY
jgi:serralysin